MTTTVAEARPSILDEPRAGARLWERHGEAVTTAACALFVATGWLASRLGVGVVGTSAIFSIGYVLGGYEQAIEGTTTLVRDRELDVDSLMVVAAIGAAIIGYWFDGALLIFIFALSGTLEGYASARTTRDIEALMALNPEEALLVREGREERVAAASLVPGDAVLVKPGERIAADGRVFEGHSAVNQAAITGESMASDKGPGDEVFAGTINGHGALRVRVVRPAGDTVLARMVQLVREAQERRPPAQLFIERFERRYAKAVVAGAVALAALPALAGWWTFRESLYRAMIFLVVASPCALAAAMMPTLLSALSNGARNGILFKGSTFIETLGRVRAVAFDKTGTVTSGHPVVTDVISFSAATADELLGMGAAIESLSEHPLARASSAKPWAGAWPGSWPRTSRPSRERGRTRSSPADDGPSASRRSSPRRTTPRRTTKCSLASVASRPTGRPWSSWETGPCRA